MSPVPLRPRTRSTSDSQLSAVIVRHVAFRNRIQCLIIRRAEHNLDPMALSTDLKCDCPLQYQRNKAQDRVTILVDRKLIQGKSDSALVVSHRPLSFAP